MGRPYQTKPPAAGSSGGRFFPLATGHQAMSMPRFICHGSTRRVIDFAATGTSLP